MEIQRDSFLTQTEAELVTPVAHQAYQSAMTWTNVTDTHLQPVSQHAG